MLGIGGAGLVVVTIAGRSRRTIITTGAILGIVGCFAPLVAHSFVEVLCFRLLAGLGCGLISSTVLSSLGKTHNPARTLGLYFAFNYALAALLFPLMPYVLQHLGRGGGYAVLGLLLCAVLMSCTRIPAGTPPGAVTDAALPRFPLRAAILSHSVSVAYWTGSGAVWAFVERLGLRVSPSESLIANILSLGQLAAIVGALTASLLHTRLGRTLPTVAAIGISVLSLVLIGVASHPAGFAAGTLLFCFAWPSFLAYLGGIMSAQDETGRVIALSVSSQTIGMAVGPAIAGMLADSFGYGAIVVMGIVCHAVALFLLIPIARAGTTL